MTHLLMRTEWSEEIGGGRGDLQEEDEGEVKRGGTSFSDYIVYVDEAIPMATC
ncbi:hypothetical protein [Ectothiorhodospira variabilis]|uniref:hypothetical protein n=1 Tax=Ectothiorhodospira variabilis TaxID=505694 RepID=UPI001EFAE84F|nr:hypothetical protein [Ectothiorhodospira variabilis]MCG5498203.1 hypothetical protein [Ectothiorhodospira variabilis]